MKRSVKVSKSPIKVNFVLDVSESMANHLMQPATRQTQKWEELKVDFTNFLRHLLEVDDLIAFTKEVPCTTIKRRKGEKTVAIKVEEIIANAKHFFLSTRDKLLSLWRKMETESNFELGKSRQPALIRRLINELFNIGGRLFPNMGNVVPC